MNHISNAEVAEFASFGVRIFDVDGDFNEVDLADDDAAVWLSQFTVDVEWDRDDPERESALDIWALAQKL